MKLVSSDGGIATLTVVPDEVRPAKGYYLPEMFRQITQRYSFAKVPTLEEARQTGAKFGTGRYLLNNEVIEIAELGIFNNGLGATTHDTTDSKLIVEDLFSWLRKTFAYRDPQTKPTWFYQSDLVVDFENSVDELLRPIDPVRELIEKEFLAATEVKKTFHFDILGVITTGVGPQTVEPQFFIQRRIGFPLGTKRYFSKAHMPTEAHLRVLEKLDSILGSQKKK